LSRPTPLRVAVTVLTSLSTEAMGEIGLAADVAEQVERLAVLAQASRMDGVVASPQEIARIRTRCGEAFAVITPGIRSSSDRRGDQSRTLTAGEALAVGATYLVVGRPVIAAPDPRAAAERIAAECRAPAS
jgi:orotidine-5'-phosphate decarboxylase